MDFISEIKKYIQESADLKRSLLDNSDFLDSTQKVLDIIVTCFKGGNKLLIAGNGGSAAEAQHFAAEIVSGYKNHERKGYPAIALTTDSSIITAWSNDKDFKTLFSRQIEALGKKGDVFLGISTSGNSENLIEGAKKARDLGIKTVCFLGRDGGKLKSLVDQAVVIPSENTPRIQEAQMMLTHVICEELENTVLI